MTRWIYLCISFSNKISILTEYITGSESGLQMKRETGIAIPNLSAATGLAEGIGRGEGGGEEE